MTEPTVDGSGTEDETAISLNEVVPLAARIGVLNYLDDPLAPHVATVGPDSIGGPQTFNADLGGAVVVLEEWYGPSPGTLSIITAPLVHLLSADTNSRQNVYGYTDAALRLVDQDTAAYTYERWIRVRFDPPYNTVRQFRFWVGNTAFIPEGWQVLWGSALTYQSPINTPSAIATTPVPTTDPGAAANAGGLQRVTGTGTNYTNWIVLQAMVDPTKVKGAGPALGFNQEGTIIPIEFHIAWIEN